MTVLRRNLALNPKTATTAGFLNTDTSFGAPTLSTPGSPVSTFPNAAVRVTAPFTTTGRDKGVYCPQAGSFTPGLAYSFTVQARCNKIQRVALSVQWFYSVDFAVGIPIQGPHVVLAAATNTLVSNTNLVAPAGATRALIQLMNAAGTSSSDWLINDWLEMGGVVIEQSATAASQYFDGDTPAGTYSAPNRYTWEGAANASASTQFIPALTLAATAEPANVPPRVALALDMSDAGGGTIPAEATIVRIDPDGRQRPVRLAEPAALVAGAWVGYDYESPFGQAVTYRATGGALTVDSSPATLAVAVPWLRHPGIPTLSVPIPTDHFRKDSLASRSRASSRATFEPMGRATPIVVVTAGARRAIQTAMAVRTDTEGERTAMWALLDDESVLLLDIPPGLSWGVTHEYVSIGDVDETRLADWGAHQSRWFGLPYIVVDRPAGGLQAQFTYTDVLANHTTYADVRSRYDTYADLLANRRNLHA